MLFRLSKFLVIFLTGLLLLSCQSNVPIPTTTPFDTFITSATAIKTSTPILITSTPPPPAPTVIAETATVATRAVNGSFSIVFMGETIPDKTVLTPGQLFQKSWTLKNGGMESWPAGFTLTKTDAIPAGETLSSPEAIPLGKTVAPGELIQISVDLVAPEQEGQYTVYYQLQDEMGNFVRESLVWVTISVCQTGNSCSATLTTGSATVNGISATLSSFNYDDQRTTVIFCMTMPNRNYALDFAPALLIDQKPAQFLEGGSSSPWNCMQMVYQTGAREIEQANHILLDIDSSLRMSPPQGDPNVACESARQSLISEYPGLDFHCQFSMAGYYTNLKFPPNLTREQADKIINDTIEGAIYGPWVLTIR
ncbi:MAG: hypothetical protein BGO78_13950 [Chloroflexi bacterium 44-23]|nr:MAG: hypothetical protein BGO78_13950 [Chloroflexi bacterium 44-23]